MPKPADCLHQEFQLKPKFTWLTNVQRYILELAVRCGDCGQRFAFQGLNVQPVNLNGASMTADGSIGKFSMAPLNQVLAPLDDMAIAALPQASADATPETDREPPEDAEFRVIE